MGAGAAKRKRRLLPKAPPLTLSIRGDCAEAEDFRPYQPLVIVRRPTQLLVFWLTPKRAGSVAAMQTDCPPLQFPGSARLTQQLFFRPIFPYFRYRTPVRGVYLASASAHPGAGVHGACGFNAARAALRDAGCVGDRALSS